MLFFIGLILFFIASVFASAILGIKAFDRKEKFSHRIIFTIGSASCFVDVLLVSNNIIGGIM